MPSMKLSRTTTHLTGSICNKLGLEMNICTAAKGVTSKIEELLILEGKQPMTIAAVSILIVTMLQ